MESILATGYLQWQAWHMKDIEKQDGELALNASPGVAVWLWHHSAPWTRLSILAPAYAPRCKKT
jgi:hypothetical protein